MSDLFDEFRALIGSANVTEPDVQRFMEEHTELIPIVDVLGHGLAWEVVLSKFEIDRSRKTDLAYITKNTAKWCVTFVELERPQKQLFTQGPHPNFTTDLSNAIAQVEDWKTYAINHPEEIRRGLHPLLHFSPRFERNPVEFKYLLIAGRWPQDEPYQDGYAERVARLEREAGITLMTYDSILRAKGSLHLGIPKNVLAHSRDTFRFKRACADTSMFAHYKPEQIDVDDVARAFFAGRGYDMESWAAGELLVLNDKLPGSKTAEAVANAMDGLKK